MTRFALRVLPTYPYGDYAGDIVTLGPAASRVYAEDVRRDMPNGHHFEVVELDDQGEVIEP